MLYFTADTKATQAFMLYITSLSVIFITELLFTNRLLTINWLLTICVATVLQFWLQLDSLCMFSCVVKNEGVSKSFRNGRLERELQMVQLSATVCSCIAILLVSLVSFAAITFVLLLNECFLLLISLSSHYGRNFSLQHRVQNGSGAHSVSYAMGTRGSFPGWSWPLTSI
jgi:hypothetical protein